MSLRKGFIIVILALVFLAAIMLFGNSVAVLATIILLMLGYSYFKWKNKHMAEEEIKAVVVSYLKPDIDWPTIITIPEERLREIKNSLANRKIVLPQATINKMVEDMLAREMELRFESSFYAYNPGLSRNTNIYQWVQAYINTFNKKTEYVPMLQRLMKKRGIRYPVKTLVEKIEEELKKQEGNKRQIKQLKKNPSLN